MFLIGKFRRMFNDAVAIIILLMIRFYKTRELFGKKKILKRKMMKKPIFPYNFPKPPTHPAPSTQLIEY